MRAILAQGADPNAVPSSGVLCCGSALFVASRRGDLEMVKLLLDKGADPNFDNFDELPPIRSTQMTALMAAAVKGNDEIAEALLKKGARVDTATSKGETALTLARLQGHDSTARLLQEWHDKVNAPPPAVPSPAEAPQTTGAKPWYDK